MAIAVNIADFDENTAEITAKWKFLIKRKEAVEEDNIEY